MDGVTDVTVDVDAASQSAPQPATPKPSGRALPVMDDRPAQPRVPAPTPVAYPNLGKIIAISSGKGGVGKSTVAVNLAVALAQQGARVGLMDADIYGPNIPLMMGVNEPPMVIKERIIPLEAHGVKVISIGFLIDRDQPAIWRGPIIMKIITQFLRDVAWGTLDYFIVDLAAGNGRRAAHARAGDAGHRRGDRHDAAGSVGRRRAARRQDVRARDRSRARHRREHELVRVSALRQAIAPLRQRRRRAAGEGARVCRSSDRFRSISA